MQASLQTGKRPTLAILILAALFSWTAAFGQQMRFMPIRSAPLGSPVGTVGDPVTPEFNTDLGCWEYRVSAGGIEVDLDIQAFGWGNASDQSRGCRSEPGGPTLGAIQAWVDPAGYSNGLGGDLNPKGWPGSPLDGAYQAKRRCEKGGDLSPCTPPFDPTCDNLNNGECVLASNWVMPECANDLLAIATQSLDFYAWATAVQVACAVDDGMVKTMGGLILEVPTDASGTYVIAFNPAPNNTFMTSGCGTPIQDLVLTPACITIATGSCCSNIGMFPNCEDNLTEQECQMRPPPQVWHEDSTCEECGCPTCISDADCDDGDACTADICDIVCSNCRNELSYDVATECCDSSTGETELIDDENACTIDTCDPTTGQVSHTDNPDCIFDADAFTKNRYVSFDTGVLPVELAFHVRMTASAHFPDSVGDLGWVGAPDSKDTALVVSDPVFLASWPAIVRVGDCEIVPAATYEIRSTSDGVNFDPPVVVDTTAPPTAKFWGDIVGEYNGVSWSPPNGVQNIADVLAAIRTFQNKASAAPLIWADVQPETPNRVANFNDVLLLVLAFTAQPYPFSAPADCP
ncbi:MAG: hypothetical protein IH897_10995 [Planctomycetes bacterium]|nr:hypothetical protein [Planctomycetota bacterium]